MKNYTSKKQFIELARELFNLLFALQTEHYIFANITNFQRQLSDIADSLKISIEFKAKVFDKYYFAPIREIEGNKEKTSDLDKYVEVDNFEVLNKHVEEARQTYLEDKKEFEQNKPGYDLI